MSTYESNENSNESTDESTTRTCAVCLEEISPDNKNTELLCKHIFHTDCIMKSLSRNNKCPMCRDIVIEQYIPSPDEIGNRLREINILEDSEVNLERIREFIRVNTQPSIKNDLIKLYPEHREFIEKLHQYKCVKICEQLMNYFINKKGPRSRCIRIIDTITYVCIAIIYFILVLIVGGVFM